MGCIILLGCFNLVIEVLLVSSIGGDPASGVGGDAFQSRNRGSFGFKGKCTKTTPLLVNYRFNLVIEVLLVSRASPSYHRSIAYQFQSRNRGSFDFKRGGFNMTEVEGHEFRSRNRGSFDFRCFIFAWVLIA